MGHIQSRVRCASLHEGGGNGMRTMLLIPVNLVRTGFTSSHNMPHLYFAILTTGKKGLLASMQAEYVANTDSTVVAGPC